MDKQRMIFNIDRRVVTEGDVVEVTWQCAEAESVMLTLDNGYRSTNISLENNGSKRFRLNRSKGKTHLTITVRIQGKEYHKRIDVRVKKIPTVRPETVDSQGRPVSKLKQIWQKWMTNCRNTFAKFKYALSTLPERKQVAAKLILLLGVILIISSIWPAFYKFAPIVLLGYLGYILLKR